LSQKERKTDHIKHSKGIGFTGLRIKIRFQLESKTNRNFNLQDYKEWETWGDLESIFLEMYGLPPVISLFLERLSMNVLWDLGTMLHGRKELEENVSGVCGLVNK